MNQISKAAAILGRKGGQAGTGQSKSRNPEVMRKAAYKGWGDPIIRFWKTVDKQGPDDCWPWKGWSNGSGYGQFVTRHKRMRSSRFAWENMNGPIPNGLLVLHKCDNPSCCNPNHLFLGTTADNVRDRQIKKRTPKGVTHWHSKLTESQVKEIRNALKHPHQTRALAKVYGVSNGCITEIKRGTNWKHI